MSIDSYWKDMFKLTGVITVIFAVVINWIGFIIPYMSNIKFIIFCGVLSVCWTLSRIISRPVISDNKTLFIDNGNESQPGNEPISLIYGKKEKENG